MLDIENTHTIFLKSQRVLLKFEYLIFQQSEITKYDQIFEGLHPVNNLLAGDKVRPVCISVRVIGHSTKFLENLIAKCLLSMMQTFQ